MTDYSPFEQRVVDQLRLFLGDEALPAHERCGRSMQRLSNLARESRPPPAKAVTIGNSGEIFLNSAALISAFLFGPMQRLPPIRRLAPTSCCWPL